MIDKEYSKALIRAAVAALSVPGGGTVSPYRIRSWLIEHHGIFAISTADIRELLAIPQDAKVEQDIMDHIREK